MLTRSTVPRATVPVPAPAIALAALLCDAVLGDPPWLDRAVGHPARWLGAFVALADRRLNIATAPPTARRLLGIGGTAGAILPPVLLAAAIQRALLVHLPRPAAVVALGALSGTLLAQRSLFEHVRAVGDALHTAGLPAGRVAVSRIVGRDTAALDEAAVRRAAIESLAENFSDGVVAPLFWGSLFGLPGLCFHKAVNTADSMIGHLSPRHAAFGWAAARLDDLVNLPASRLSALLLVAASPRGARRRAWRIVRRDAPRHRSPNAGWPEAAMAEILDLRLAGPRSYGGRATADPPMGDGRRDPGPEDLARALRLYRRACLLQAIVPAAVLAVRTLATRPRAPR